MKWNILKSPLGMSDMSGGYAPRKKEVLPLAVPLAFAAASAATSIFGGVKSANANREAQKALKSESNATEAERRRRLAEGYLDTSAGQNLLRILREERDKIWKREEGSASVAGGTEAAKAMAKEAGNNMTGDTVANIAAQDTARNDAIDASYRADLSRLNQQQIAAQQAQGQADAQAASGASNAFMNAALATFGGTKLGQSWLTPSSGEVSPGSGGGSPAQTPKLTFGQTVAQAAPGVSDALKGYAPKMIDAVGGYDSNYNMMPWKNLYSFYHPNL